MELNIELRCLSEGCLNAAYLGYLATDMEMDELETVFHVQLLQLLQCGEELRTGESELAGVAAALLPFSASRRGELDAHAEVRTHTEFLGCLRDDVYLVELLHHDEDALAHLLCEEGELDVALVFVSVADYERVALTLHGDDGMELRLGTGLKTEVELAAMADDLFHHGLHLVHLDRIYHEALSLVVVGLGCLLKAA